MKNLKKELKKSVLNDIVMFTMTLAIIIGIASCSNIDDAKDEEDNPYLGYYFDYQANSFVQRPYKLSRIDVNSKDFSDHAADFNKCKKSCYTKNLIPQDYFHDYIGECKCLTIKDKIVQQQKEHSR